MGEFALGICMQERSGDRRGMRIVVLGLLVLLRLLSPRECGGGTPVDGTVIVLSQVVWLPNWLRMWFSDKHMEKGLCTYLVFLAPKAIQIAPCSLVHRISVAQVRSCLVVLSCGY